MIALERNNNNDPDGGLRVEGGTRRWSLEDKGFLKSPGNSDKTDSAPGLKYTDLRNTECSLYTNTYTVLYIM